MHVTNISTDLIFQYKIFKYINHLYVVHIKILLCYF